MNEKLKYLLSLLEVSECCYPLYAAVVCELADAL